jgi:translation initiation factor 1
MRGAADAMKSVTVYSTEHGAVCAGCGKPASRCACRSAKAPPPADGTVRVGRETKGRKGKGVTLVSGLALDAAGLAALAKELKQRCGTGGTVKGGVIEIQGDHRDRLVEELQARGHRVKRAGG